jgi:hypothetical protein
LACSVFGEKVIVLTKFTNILVCSVFREKVKYYHTYRIILIKKSVLSYLFLALLILLSYISFTR